jgi:hypothetical protein
MRFIKELGWHFRRTLRNKIGSYDVRYGQIRGGEQGFISLLAISQTIYSTDFKLVTISGGTATIAASSAVKFAGVMEVEGIPNSVNTGTSLGTEKRKVVNDPTAIYRIPIISGTYSDATYLGVRCDYVNNGAGARGAALAGTSYKQLIIMGGDIDDNQWVDVRLEPTMIEAS